MFAANDADMESAFEKILVTVRTKAAFEGNVDGRVLFLELAQKAWHVVLGKYVGAGDGKGTKGFSHGFCKGAADFLIAFIRFVDVLDQHLPLTGKKDPSGLADEKLAAEFCFEPF